MDQPIDLNQFIENLKRIGLQTDEITRYLESLVIQVDQQQHESTSQV